MTGSRSCTTSFRPIQHRHLAGWGLGRAARPKPHPPNDRCVSKRMIRTVHATRYVTPLREGGSLPAIVEADDDGMYVSKFRGAGQGQKVLIAELLCGELGRALGLPVPELVFVELDPALGQNEPDDEIQALITASAGLNLALDYLPGSLAGDPLNARAVDPALASAVVWFDAYLMNVDRTPRNPNLLWWHRKLWLIDHGAALYVHYTWTDYLARASSRFPAIRDHILLPTASTISPQPMPGSRRRSRQRCSNRWWQRSPTPGWAMCRCSPTWPRIAPHMWSFCSSASRRRVDL